MSLPPSPVPGVPAHAPALDRARRAELLAAELADAACESHAPGERGAAGRLRLARALDAWTSHVADLDTLAQA